MHYKGLIPLFEQHLIIRSREHRTTFYTLGYEQTKNSDILKPCQRIVMAREHAVFLGALLV